MDAIIKRSGGVALGVQNSYADALKGVRCEDRPPPSIGYQYPVYAPGNEPKPMTDGPTINVGGKPLRV